MLLRNIDGGQPETIKLPRGGRPYVRVVGRAPDNDVVLKQKSVSGRHAVIEVGGPPDFSVFLRDGVNGKASRFGTFVGESHLKVGLTEPPPPFAATALRTHRMLSGTPLSSTERLVIVPVP